MSWRVLHLVELEIEGPVPFLIWARFVMPMARGVKGVVSVE